MIFHRLRSVLPFSFLLWFGAFVCALYPINKWEFEFFTACFVLLLLWTYRLLSARMTEGWLCERSPVLWLAGGFWLLVLASAFWSDVKSVSLIGLCFFSVFPLTFFTGVLGGNEIFFRRVAYALAGVFAFLAVWAAIQFFFLNAYFWGQARHPLADPSSLGALFSLALFCALGWVLADRPKREHICAVVLATLLTCGIIATVARGPVFAFLPGIAVFCIALWPQIKAKRKSFLAIILGAAAFFALTQTDIPKEFDFAQRMMGTITMEVQDVSNNRINIWKGTWDMIQDHPWLGTGIGTYFLYYPAYRLSDDTNGAFTAHNDPLQFWSELGIFGPLLFYAFCIATAVRSVRALLLLKAPEQRGQRILITALMAGLFSMIVQSHVSFNHSNLSILLLSGLMLSIWFKVSGEVLGRAQHAILLPDNLPSGAGKALIALPLLMIGWLFLSVAAGDIFVNRARDDLFAERMLDFKDNINRAHTVSHGLNYRLYLLAVNVPMAILEYNVNANEQQKKELYDQVAGYMDELLFLNPRASAAHYYLGKVQEMVPASVIPEGAKTPEEEYREALRLDPAHIGARLALYRHYAEEGKKPEELLAVLEPGLTFMYSNPLAMDLYGEASKIYLATGNYEKMKGTLDQMAQFKKRDEFSLKRQKTSLPDALREGNALFGR